MDRRTYTFIVASAAFMFFYLSLRTLVAPPQQQNVDPQGNVVAQQDDTDQASEPSDQTEPGASSKEILAQDVSDEPETGTPSTRGTPQWFSLGSMDPNSKHQLLITFSNLGGAIERIEITKRDSTGSLAYRRVDTRSGYLGYFAGESSGTVDGMVVNVVGAGTPAALAVAETGEKGIRVGDVIVAVAGSPVTSDQDIFQALAKTKPGESVSVEVTRNNNDDGNIVNLLFEAKLDEHPLDLVRLARDGGYDQIEGNLSRLSCLLTLARLGNKSVGVGDRSIKAIGNPEDQVWTASVSQTPEGADSILFETIIGSKATGQIGGEPVRLQRSFTIRPSSYIVEMDVEVANLGEKPQDVALRLEGPNGITLEGWWYSNKISPNFGGAAARDVVYRTTSAGHELLSGASLLKHHRNNPEDTDYGIFAGDSSEAEKNVSYIGIDAQYFAVSYLPVEGKNSLDFFDRSSAVLIADADGVPKHQERAVNVSFFLNTKTVELAPGKAYRQQIRLFAGPKEPELLASYGLRDFVYYGWFSLFSTLLSSLLHILQSVVGNYAIAIILLTVVVRGAMFPLSRKAAVNAQRMQELAPEMKKIAEKYKDDMEGRLKAQQALQKKVGFNPLAGCLPMFLQLPIFMGLYRALSVDIDLRQKPMWSPNGWASNLAAPDQFTFWGDWMWETIAGRGTGWLGPYLNLLPLIVVVLFITQQKLFMPPATDEQTAMTQKVMTFMTLFMGLFFFRVPAGLCVYFIASSLWGIAERLIVKRTLPKGKHFNLDDDSDVIDAVASTKKTGNSKGESMTLAERIMQQVNQKEPETPATRPNKRKRPPAKKKR